MSTAHGNTAAGKTANGDMYAGHDGNVYKNTGSGWEKYDNGSWNNVQKPTNTSNYSSAQQKAQSNPNSSANQQKAQSYNQQRTSGDSGYSKPSGGSYGDLNQEAQNRQRGAEQSQRFSQEQHSGWGGSGGGDRWGGGGGGRSWGGGGGGGGRRR